jgi:3-deoxy-7-phosphoheptulonate synthase
MKQTMYVTDDIRIREMMELSTPKEVHDELPITEQASKTVFDARNQAQKILSKEDNRLLVIVGPCSIHDTDAALDYAQKLKEQAYMFQKELLIFMRVYFEKPRTTVGWKGLINDPNLDGSFEINKGMRMARELLLKLAEMHVPAGTEYLDLISPQYVADLVSWGAIGARTTESQCHRELASGLSCPVGFKNGTDGNIQIAVDAIGSACRPHHFLSVTKDGRSAIFSTAGNEYCHIIMRGGSKNINYDSESVEETASRLERAGLPLRVMIDCSHANSEKMPEKQLNVAKVVSSQIAQGDERIVGVMIESNLVGGRQDIKEEEGLVYGQSITDPCIGWDDTCKILSSLSEAVAKRS